MLTKLKILLLEDLPSDADLICREISRAKILSENLVVDCKADFIKALSEFSPDIILSDHTLPSFNSLEALKILSEKSIKIPFILVTGTMSEEFAVRVMRQGAWDYIQKGQLQQLPEAINKAIEKFKYQSLRQKFNYEAILTEAYMQEAERLAHFGSWEIDIVNKKIKLSKEAGVILDYEQGESENFYQSMLNRVPLEEALHISNLVRDVLSNSDATSYKDSFRLINNAGDTRVIETEFVLKYNLDLKLIRINGYIQDITDLISTEEKLYESEERFRSLTENMDEAIIIMLSADGNIKSLSRKAQGTWGYTENEIKNKPVSLLYVLGDTQNSSSAYHLKLTSETGRFEDKIDYLRKDGSTFWASVVITDMKSKSGDLNGFIMVIHEIFPVNTPDQIHEHVAVRGPVNKLKQRV